MAEESDWPIEACIVCKRFKVSAQKTMAIQRLSHPDGKTMTKVLSWELFDGLLYVIAQYDDGSVIHFYDGAVVQAARVSYGEGTRKVSDDRSLIAGLENEFWYGR